MPRIENFRSPYDRTAGDLHHLGRMFDKIRLMQAGQLPEDYHRNYGLSVGLDGQLCGFLNVKFADVEARVRAGATDAEMVEWIFTHGLRPSRMQGHVWNEHARKLGWNDRISSYLEKTKHEMGQADHPACTAFDLIELNEERQPPARKG